MCDMGTMLNNSQISISMRYKVDSHSNVHLKLRHSDSYSTPMQLYICTYKIQLQNHKCYVTTPVM